MVSYHNGLPPARRRQLCAGGFSAADFPPADVPPGLVQNPASDMTRSNMDNDENPEKCEHEE